MEQYTTISDSYVIDKTFTIQGEENGRLRIDPNENGTPFFIQDLVPKNEKTNYSNATKYMFSPTLLSKVYFSAENITIIQNAIRAEIYKKTNKKYIIDNQNYDQLKIIMRSLFLQYSLHQEHNIKEQVKDLNKKVIDYCVPHVYGELISYLKYKKDISTLPTPIDHPIRFSSDKTVQLNRFF